MSNPYQIEQATEEVSRQEIIRQQEMEARLVEAEAARQVEVNQAAVAGMRTEAEAMAVQVRERVSTSQVEVEIRVRQTEQIRQLEVEQGVFAKRDVAPSTDQQVQGASDALRDMPELRPEVWQGLNDGQRLEALQNVENRMAEIQGRPPVEVRAEKMDPQVEGYYSRGDRIIRVNADHLRRNDNGEVLDTIVHEGRHAYQHYAVETPGFHANQSEVDAWEYNMHNYRRPEIYGQRAYERQAIEADARSYAERVIHNTRGG